MENIENNDFLKNLKKETGNGGFAVPEGYFESITAKAEAAIKSTETNKSDFSWRPLLAIAAGFLLIFGLWSVVLRFIPQEKVEIAEVPLSTEEIVDDYMAYNTNNANAFEMVATSETDFSNEDEAIIEYLSEEADLSIVEQ
ncbi:MAG TPA: hypothetical protein DCQ31_10785 [Bacteroidales bacterium]|nr:hypothetical protein [Bacteroidales bacterium]